MFGKEGKKKKKDKDKDGIKVKREHAPFEFELGEAVKDKITGFKGVVTYRSQWLNGCNTYGVMSRELKDGTPQNSVHFDEPQLEAIDEEPAPVSADRARGGPAKPIQLPGRV